MLSVLVALFCVAWLVQSLDDADVGGGATERRAARAVEVADGLRGEPERLGAAPRLEGRVRQSLRAAPKGPGRARLSEGQGPGVDKLEGRSGPAAPLADDRCRRCYDLPRLPAGWGWTQRPRGERPGGAAYAGAPTLVVDPADVTDVIECSVAPGGWGGADRAPGLALEDRRRLVVQASPAIQDRIAEYVESRSWTPTWLGLSNAAEEIADMTLCGSPAERRWAHHAWRRAASDLRDAADRAVARQGSVQPTPAPAPAPAEASPHRIRLDLVFFLTDHDFIRDCGVDYKGDSRRDRRYDASVQSARTYVDDAQVEVLEEALTRGDRLRLIERRSVWLESGRVQSIELGADAVLRVEAWLSSSAKFITLRLGLRIRADEQVVFAPRSAVTGPEAGTLLLQPSDTLSPEGPPTPRHLLLLTASAEP